MTSFNRRQALNLIGASLSGWLAPLASHAAASKRKHKSCILLWMDGGPSHVDTFDPKPDAGSQIRGDFKAIQTTVPGILMNEKFAGLSRWTPHMALLRGMCTDEADHGRARVYMHTGYKPGIGGVTHPGLGSVVSAELGEKDFPLPNFVATGTPLNKYDFIADPGYRGPQHTPLSVYDPGRGLENLQPNVGDKEFNDRVGVLEKMEQSFARTYQAPQSDSHQTTLAQAIRLIRSDKAKAFDLSDEPAKVHQAYGDHYFGRGCLLARRLVETGVPFVEVYLSNWDGHGKQEAQNARNLLPILDTGMSALLADLKDHGLLDDTLVIWMGEFGRTPWLNNAGGRDHYSKAWSTVLAGGGIKGGQTIGATDAQAREVKERPISAKDFMASVCRILGIDPAKAVETPDGRPITIADKDHQVIRELFA